LLKSTLKRKRQLGCPGGGMFPPQVLQLPRQHTDRLRAWFPFFFFFCRPYVPQPCGPRTHRTHTHYCFSYNVYNSSFTCFFFFVQVLLVDYWYSQTCDRSLGWIISVSTYSEGLRVQIPLRKTDFPNGVLHGFSYFLQTDSGIFTSNWAVTLFVNICSNSLFTDRHIIRHYVNAPINAYRTSISTLAYSKRNPFNLLKPKTYIMYRQL
jgi:hypothetical protein